MFNSQLPTYQPLHLRFDLSVMNEANAPLNPQDPSELESAASVWSLPSIEGSESTNGLNQIEAQSDVQATNEIFDASALINAFEEESDLLLPDTSEVESVESDLSVPDNLSSIAAWSQEAGIQPEAPNLAELIALIQDLNQCNSALMERVTQLEEALECSQTALQAEVSRTQDVQTVYNAQDWTAVQDQVTTLFNQLEFAHQTNQRQQILIETITGQLENSQERVAQLEREAALIQQRYNEQTQILQKSEAACRDLQSRLQRQQRYTLQFKAALEKSLEVPTPHYEASPIAVNPEMSPEIPVVSLESPFPKVPRIQPWSAQTHSAAKASPWMKLQNLNISALEPVDDSAPEPAKAEPAAHRTPHLHLPAFDMPLLQLSTPEVTVSDVLSDPNLAQQVQQIVDELTLKQQVDQVVKPLADMLAEALLADQVQTSQTGPALGADPSALEGAKLAASMPSNSVPSNSVPSNASEPLDAEALLASTMAEAEDALWQDLARLIDVAPEDVVKASLTGDLAAFESIDFTAIQSEPAAAQPAVTSKPAPPSQPSQLSNQSSSQPSQAAQDAAQIAPLVRRLAQTGTKPAHPQPNVAAGMPTMPVPTAPAATSSSAESDPIPALASPSWPSPVVYPLRPTKKRHSLAMVDLPTFPQG